MNNDIRLPKSQALELCKELEPIRHAKVSDTVIITKSPQTLQKERIKSHKRSENNLEDITSEIDSLLMEDT